MHDLVHFLQCVSEVQLREFFRTAILPMGDRVGFARGEPLVLQSSPFVSVFGWAVALSALGGRSFSGNRSNLGSSDMCTCVQADTASLGSPMPRSLQIVSKNFAPTTCEAEVSCNVNTALFCILCRLQRCHPGARVSR